MPLLPPTVHERLARCGTQVALSGLVAGATVEVTVGAAVHTFTATGGGFGLTVPPLAAGDLVTARQDDGSGLTPPSPPIAVEGALVPPAAAPLLPSDVGSCSQCVRVAGMVPGCEVALFVAGAQVGGGRVGRDGTACVAVKLERLPDKSPTLTAHMTVCGSTGPDAGTPIVPDPPLGRPVIGSPLYGCQSVVPLADLRRGAKTMLETDTGTYLGFICNCWDAVHVYVLHSLVAMERVRARQYWDSELCTVDGPWSAWRDVIPPDEGIRPTVQEALVEGDQLVRVENQIPGGEIVVLVRDDATTPEVRWGPRPAAQDPEIALAAPLVAGQQVAAEQRLCSRVEVSDWVTVLAAPPVVLPPVVVPPLRECAGSVVVTGLHAGALVRIYQDDVPCGVAWAGVEPSIVVAAAPSLVVGAMVTARQTVGGVVGPLSDPVEVTRVGRLREPRIVPPVAEGDTEVVVTGVTPGALVTVTSGGAFAGERHAAEPLVRVSVSPVGGPVQASVRLCGRQATGPAVDAITSPCAVGGAAGVGELDLDYGTIAIPPLAVPGQTEDDGGYDSVLRGRLYFPGTSSGKLDPDIRDRPLVLIAHGLWSSDVEDQSHLGYAWLARHLAAWGMFVFSLDLVDVNLHSWSSTATQQAARAELILEALDRLLADRSHQGRFDADRIGLVGHSMGGEGVVVAQATNLGRPNPVGIRGVVSLAPTHWRPDISLTDAVYLQLHGSLDYLLSSPGTVTGADPPFGAFRLYDRAWRHRTHAFVVGGRHQGWNPNWWNGTGGESEGDWPVVDGSLTPDDHAEIGRCLINAFFQDALFGRSEYRGYLEGLVRPPSLAGYDVRLQHQARSVRVVDDHGDADLQLGLAEETPLDPGTNRQGGAIAVVGLGAPTDWDDVEHVTLPRSVHDTRSTDVRWSAPSVVYESRFPPMAVDPTEVLSLRVSQHYEEDAAGDPVETWNPVGLDSDLLVELRGGGESAVVRLGAAALVPYPALAAEPLSVFRTARVPVDAFIAVNPSLDVTAIDQVTLRLLGRPTGRLHVDDVEFAR